MSYDLVSSTVTILIFTIIDFLQNLQTYCSFGFHVAFGRDTSFFRSIPIVRRLLKGIIHSVIIKVHRRTAICRSGLTNIRRPRKTESRLSSTWRETDLDPIVRSVPSRSLLNTPLWLRSLNWNLFSPGISLARFAVGIYPWYFQRIFQAKLCVSVNEDEFRSFTVPRAKILLRVRSSFIFAPGGSLAQRTSDDFTWNIN